MYNFKLDIRILQCMYKYNIVLRVSSISIHSNMWRKKERMFFRGQPFFVGRAEIIDILSTRSNCLTLYRAWKTLLYALSRLAALVSAEFIICISHFLRASPRIFSAYVLCNSWCHSYLMLILGNLSIWKEQVKDANTITTENRTRIRNFNWKLAVTKLPITGIHYRLF